MKLKKPQINFTKILFSHTLFYSIATLIVIGIFGWLSYFVYENFYLAITQADEIVLLRQEIAPDFIDTKRFDEASAQLSQRAEQAPPVITKDPFASNVESQIEPAPETSITEPTTTTPSTTE